MVQLPLKSDEFYKLLVRVTEGRYIGISHVIKKLFLACLMYDRPTQLLKSFDFASIEASPLEISNLR